MSVLLFIFYALLFSVLIYKYRIYRYFELPQGFVLLLFWVKVSAGLLYVYIHERYYGGGDIIAFQRDGKIVYECLFKTPSVFFKIMLLPKLDYLSTDLYDTVRHLRFWYDNGSLLIIKLLAIFNIFSFGNSWTNTIFFELFTMTGLLSLYKTFANYFPNKKVFLLIALFGIPSTLFWSSGISKDGFNLTCIGLLFLCLNDLVSKEFSLIKVVIATLSILSLLAIRGYEITIMLPGLIAMYWVYKKPKQKILKYSVCYFLSIAFFFIIEQNLNLGFLNFIVQKQNQFIENGLGKSMLQPLALAPNWQSFLFTAPHALYRALFRPNIFQFNSGHEFIYAIIHTLYLLMCLGLASLYILFRKSISNLALFCIYYSVAMMVFIGWEVPNVGAMVRYTSCAYTFFTLFFVLIVDENRFSFVRKIHNKLML